MSAGHRESAAVAEIQGLDGAFSFAERLLQRIWHRLDFDPVRAVTVDGRAVKVFYPGKWNRLGGPDFFGARLEIGGVRVEGDIELHLHAADWAAHHHGADPSYARVVLHVVLFPSSAKTFGASGREIPVLALLPLLYRSLEEYAEDDAVERLANHPLAAAQEALLAMSREEQCSQLKICAEQRWTQKVRFAAKRVERLGWSEACHQTALEILGYRFNRGPMLLLAAEYPLDCWPSAGLGEELEKLCAVYAPRWNRQAVRPANLPKTRLRQYAAWTSAVKSWPERLADFGDALKVLPSDSGCETAAFRKQFVLRDLTDRMAAEVCGDAVGGTRLYTLIADGLWPLLATCVTTPEAGETIRRFWYHGYPGDLPDTIVAVLNGLGLTDRVSTPLSHGLGQSLLGWVWRHEDRLQQTTACL